MIKFVQRSILLTKITYGDERRIIMQKSLFSRTLLLIMLYALCGCQMAGGVSAVRSERWLSHFMDSALAHSVCWHEPVDANILISLYKAWYVNDDIAYIILTHPSFPHATRAMMIKREGVSDFYFDNAIRAKKYSREDLISYLDFASRTWFSACAPLYSLMLVKGENVDYYSQTWLLYKEKRERIPFFGLVFPFGIVKKLGIDIRKDELRDIAANEDIPPWIRDEIAVQLGHVATSPDRHPKFAQ